MPLNLLKRMRKALAGHLEDLEKLKPEQEKYRQDRIRDAADREWHKAQRKSSGKLK